MSIGRKLVLILAFELNIPNAEMDHKNCKLFIRFTTMIWWAALLVEGICFDVKGDLGSKCVSEEIQTNVIILTNFLVVNHDSSLQPHNISIKVSSLYGNSLYHTENIALGQSGFTTAESSNYVAYFWIPNSPYGVVATVDLDWKVGVAAKDSEAIARKEKIEGVELELRKIEVAIESIHENLLYIKSRELEMREISEITNSRVAWFSIMSLTVCLSVAAWQLWHLKRFFEKKKLI